MAVADKCLVDGADETLQLLDVACQVWKGGEVWGSVRGGRCSGSWVLHARCGETRRGETVCVLE